MSLCKIICFYKYVLMFLMFVYTFASQLNDLFSCRMFASSILISLLNRDASFLSFPQTQWGGRPIGGAAEGCASVFLVSAHLSFILWICTHIPYTFLINYIYIYIYVYIYTFLMLKYIYFVEPPINLLCPLTNPQ